MKVILLLGLVLVLLLGVVDVGPVSAQESVGEKWVLEYIDSPDEGEEFRQSLDNNVGFETGSVNLNAGSVSYNYQKEKDGTVLHYYGIETLFDRPPEELIPGETIELNFSNRVVSNSKDIDVGARYYYSVRDSNLGEIARADIDRFTPTATLIFTVPDTNSGELVIFFRHQFFHDLGVEWRYRRGEPAPVETAECAKKRQEVADKSAGRGDEALSKGIIGNVLAQTGDVLVNYCSGGHGTLKKGDEITIGDCIRTGPKGRARIMMNDRDEKRNAGPSVINIAANSEMCFKTFLINFDDPPENNTIIGMIKGTIRTFFRGWGRNSSVSIRTGVTVCGIRGSDVIVSYDPTEEIVEAYVIDGHMDITNTETGETKSLTNNQKLVVENSNIGDIQPLSQEEWDSLVKENGLEDMQPLNQVKTDKTDDKDKAKTSGGMNWLDIVLLVALVAASFMGLKQGLIKAVLSLAGLIVGVILASNFYKTLGNSLEFIPNETAAGIIAYALILIIVMIIASVLARLLKTIISIAMLGWVNRLGGAIFGLILGVILWGAILAVWVKFFGAGLVTESLIAGVLLDKFPLVLALLPGEFDSIRNYFK